MGAIKRKISKLINRGFQKGQKSLLKGKKGQYLTDNKKKKGYVRLNAITYRDRINEENKILTFKDVDGSNTPVKPLRPKCEQPSYAEDYCRSICEGDDPDSSTYKLWHPQKTALMFNTEIRKHMQSNKLCIGNLVVDGCASRKWGLCWQERLKCNECDFLSSYYKLYDEVPSRKRGRKSAKPNVGFQIGIATTPIGNTGACRILNSANVIAPSISSMQKQATRVNKAKETLNELDMVKIKQSVVSSNNKIGQEIPQMINVEADSCYNNPIFKTDSTPFQGGTIVTTTIKKILGVYVGSKLCKITSELRNKVETIECPNHRGHCTSNLKPDEAIGSEGKWSEVVASSMSKDIKIANFTCDGDSRSYAGVCKGQKHKIGHLKDLRH
ncbi:hypothetical protein MAR_005541 [Mya arenaria]|uniref:Mutator-like transposase domain-containing protein n=1 Tax=Mya arenaria TaxID=6604 RepID=A0ABY7F307_MYAAR|nr:hypothetical protein MAR_005541 [Mya arenaria]